MLGLTMASISDKHLKIHFGGIISKPKVKIKSAEINESSHISKPPSTVKTKTIKTVLKAKRSKTHLEPKKIKER